MRSCVVAIQSALDLSEHLGNVETQLSGDFNELHDIQPPLTTLILRDERLRFTKASRKLGLGQTQLGPPLFKALTKHPVRVGMEVASQNIWGWR
jgi:hypothetical protein